MSNKKSIIEKNGLVERVQELLKNGVVVAREIEAALKEENPELDISYASVARCVAKIKEEVGEDALGIIRDHVKKTVPGDLETLEELEAVCLEWSREAAVPRAERVAKAAARIDGDLALWADRILSASEEEKNGVIQWVIKKAVEYMSIDDRKQNQRLRAMKEVRDIIDLKLRHAGLIDRDQVGRVVIMKNDALPGGRPSGEGRIPYVIQGGKS
jgi:hypothetical protein